MIGRMAAGLAAAVLWLALVGPAGAQAPDVRFGAVDAFFHAERADEMGVTWSRIMFPWDRVQREGAHEWWPAVDEAIIDAEVRRGRKLVGVLLRTPEWASSGSGRIWARVPRNLDLPIDQKENYWAEYVRRTAAAYRGRIDTWVVWNEPDIWDDHHPGFTWAGSVEEFYRLQKVAYLAARRGNPEAQVVLPGLTYWWDRRGDRTPYLERLLDVAVKDPEARANGWFFDAAVLQLYNDPQLLYEVPTLFKKIMADRGIAKPIWINETNVAPWDDLDRPLSRAHFRATQEEQASYLVQAYSLALAAGVDRIALYKLSDEPHWQFGWESYGVVRADGSVRPGFTALQMLHRLYAGVRGGWYKTQDGVAVVTLHRPGERIVVLWSRGPRPASVRLQATGAGATLYTRDGVGRPIAATNGAYALELAPATHNTVTDRPEIYQVGGAPAIVVEAGPAVEAQVTVVPGALVAPPEPLGLLGRALESLRAASRGLEPVPR